MKEIKSYLPVFRGFYSTIFESDIAEEYALENADLYLDDVEFDYKDYRDRVAVGCISSVWNYLKLDGFEIDIQFDKVWSPRFYNFENDAIYCTYFMNDADFNKLVDYCKANLSEFKTFLDENYASRPGFISFFDTDAETWFNEYLNEDSDKFEKAFAGILEFYLQNKEYTEENMYDDVADETSYIDFEILEKQ